MAWADSTGQDGNGNGICQPSDKPQGSGDDGQPRGFAAWKRLNIATEKCVLFRLFGANVDRSVLELGVSAWFLCMQYYYYMVWIQYDCSMTLTSVV